VVAVLTDAELFERLPSRQQGLLARAIGCRLLEVERLFLLDPPSFLEDERFRAEDFFVRNSGPIQFHFEGSLTHVFAVWGEQLSIVVMPEPLSDGPYDRLYRLSETASAPPALRACLGQVCLDVRIWTLQEDFESAEAKEAAVSYLFEGGRELFYCIYLHGESDNDYLLSGEDVTRDRVAQGFSLARGETIDPRE
jgi:hypothetical protein